MTVATLRPTFEIASEKSVPELMQCAKAVVQQHADDFEGQFTNQHAMISIVTPKRHFWSPWLHVEVLETAGRSQIRCRFSPHPSIWTGFMFAYLSLGVIVFFAIMFGISQQLAGQTAWAYWLVPVGGVIAGLLWVAAQAGQKLADAEMRKLKMAIEECCGVTEEVN